MNAALLAADRAHVVAAMSGFRGLPGDQWLRPSHPASTGEFAGKWAVVGGLPASDLIEAVAVAAPNHCLDGWSYAARATASLLAGDYHACRHLSYYAQLRAGLSILANLGIGLFNRVNFAIDAGGAIHRLDQGGTFGTHDAVWEALSTWSNDVTAAGTFLELVRIRGTTLRDILQVIWPGVISSAVAAPLIKDLGIDLQRGRQEHGFRNVSSYNIQVLNPLICSVSDSLELVHDMWSLCDPTAGGSFNELDRFLIRSLLQSIHRSVNGDHNYAAGAIARHHSALPPLIQATVSKKFLTGEDGSPDPTLLSHALSTAQPALPVEMLARSYLLLRVATAFTHTSLIEAGLDLAGNDLRPWLDGLADRRGFWDPGHPFPDLTDLHADIADAMDEFESARDPTPISWHDWLSVPRKGLPHLAEMERIGVWSLSA